MEEPLPARFVEGHKIIDVQMEWNVLMGGGGAKILLSISFSQVIET